MKKALIGIIGRYYGPQFMGIRLGHPNYEDTYDFPVHFRRVKTVKGNFHGYNLKEYIKCAKQLELDGMKAIVSHCGKTGVMQKKLAAAVSVPVFTSSLLQLPMICASLSSGKKVGVMLASYTYLLLPALRASCDINDRLPVVYYNMPQKGSWRNQYNKKDCNFIEVERVIVQEALNMIRHHSSISAIVLECTEMPIFAHAIMKATGLPVFDMTTLTRCIHYSLSKEDYLRDI